MIGQYAVIDRLSKGNNNESCDLFGDDYDGCISAAWATWEHLTPNEKKDSIICACIIDEEYEQYGTIKKILWENGIFQ